MFDWLVKRGTKGASPAATFPYPLETVHGRDAFATYERLKRAGKGSPVILGSDDAVHKLVELIAYSKNEGQTTEHILRLADESTFPASLREDQANRRRNIKEEHPDWEENYEPRVGTWPLIAPFAPKGPSVSHNALTQLPHKRVHIALIPHGRSNTDPGLPAVGRLE